MCDPSTLVENLETSLTGARIDAWPSATSPVSFDLLTAPLFSVLSFPLPPRPLPLLPALPTPRTPENPPDIFAKFSEGMVWVRTITVVILCLLLD